jgi:tyrosyl-tRNA synthetase
MKVLERVLPIKPIIDEQKIDRLLTRGVAAVYPTAEKLREVLLNGRRLRIYVGIDPTSPHLHIGHAMQFRKLREFQDLGHEVIMLIGSFTAMIGDPTDKLATRKQLTKQEVLANAKTYKKQAEKILRFKGENAVQLKFNDKWLSKMSFEDVIGLASHFTVQQMMERDMFEKRLEDKKPIGIHEFMYPLMQGYDSVAMDVDVELGGNDQTFNMLAGRTLLREMKQKEKFVVAISLLTNSEGKKMSKSEGGVIALTDTPEDMFGKIMAMDDSMIVPYFTLATDVADDEISAIQRALEEGMNPRDIKIRLAEMVTGMYHDAQKATAAKAHFVQVFSRREMPDAIPTFAPTRYDMTIVDVIVEANLAPSKGEARRLIEQGGVKIGGDVVTDPMLAVYPRKEEIIVQKGKRFFVKLLP